MLIYYINYYYKCEIKGIMSNNKSSIKLNLIVFLITIFISVFSFVLKWQNSVLVLVIVSLSVILNFLIFTIKSTKILTLLNFTLLISIVCFAIYSNWKIFDIFFNINELKILIAKTGNWGRLVYVIIQSLQIIILPIPAAIINLAGVVIYGPLEGSILCSVGVLIGSYISFLLGKMFGNKISKFLVGETLTNKYVNILENKMFLTIAFLLPMFPDDILCLIAGLTQMKFKTFFIITTITRPISVVSMSYFGGGYIIPYSGWGLYVWPIIIIVALLVSIISYKYQAEIEKYTINKIKNITKNFKIKK